MSAPEGSKLRERKKENLIKWKCQVLALCIKLLLHNLGAERAGLMDECEGGGGSGEWGGTMLCRWCQKQQWYTVNQRARWLRTHRRTQHKTDTHVLSFLKETIRLAVIMYKPWGWSIAPVSAHTHSTKIMLRRVYSGVYVKLSNLDHEEQA